MTCRPSAGVTLIELSIVMLIIGLVTAAIIVGRDLIRAAEIRKVHEEADQIITAIATFEAKYNCLSGDCAKATDFFADALNGDGNGLLDAPLPFGQFPPSGNAFQESVSAWRELAEAGLIAGNYNGQVDSTCFWNARANSPPVLSTSVAWVLDDVNSDGGSIVTAAPQSGGMLLFTWPVGTPALPGPTPDEMIFGANDMFAYDMKYDDGYPTSGQVTADDVGNCTSQFGDQTQYTPTDTTAFDCGPVIATGF